MEKNQYLSLPFPYFYINTDSIIIETNYDKCYLGEKIIDFLEVDSVEDFLQFISEQSEKQSEIYSLCFQQDVSPFRIYKQQNDNEYTHLFLHPIEKSTIEPIEQIKVIKQKNHQIEECKKELMELRNKYDEGVFQSTYLKNIGQLAAGIAHEIRNPLTTIKGFIQLLKPSLVDIKKEEYATIALEEIDRANEILYQFLNAAKPDKNQLKEVRLNKLIQEICLLFEGELNIKNIHLRMNLEPSEPQTIVDESQLKQVLINMIKNAMEAIYSSNCFQGELNLSTKATGDKAVITIQDNGCGMGEKSLESLFTPFYSTKSEGTGLGLSICKKIVDSHGGNIQIASSEGEGTTFTIELPVQSKYKLHA